MNPLDLTPQQVAATDFAVLVTMFTLPAYIFLMTAMDGRGNRSFGLTNTVSWRLRLSRLITANVLIIGVLLFSYFEKGVGPVDLWHAASFWKGQGVDFGWPVAIGTWMALLSPIPSLIAAALIFRARARERIVEPMYAHKL